MERIAAGERRLVVDLQACTGMDSTFMGTLAGIAGRLSPQQGGIVQIADPGPKNRRSLEDLGLDFLIELAPPQADWLETIDSIRSSLTPTHPLSLPNPLQQTADVLEAHRILSRANEKNTKVFSNVVTLLEKELSEKEQAAKTPETNQPLEERI